MDFSLTETQQQTLAYGGELARKYDRRYWLEHAGRREFPMELWRQLGKDGYLGILVPEEYGGSGLGMTEQAVFIEGIAEQGFPLLLLLTGPSIALPALARFGTPEQKSRILPRICRGEELVCFAITEADAGSNRPNLKTFARPHGGRYLTQRGADYARERVVFDAPIGAYQGVQHPLARARTQVELARLMTLQAAWQAQGGYGYTRDAGIYDIYQACRLLRSAPVNRERVLCFIGERTLGLPRSY